MINRSMQTNKTKKIRCSQSKRFLNEEERKLKGRGKGEKRQKKRKVRSEKVKEGRKGKAVSRMTTYNVTKYPWKMEFK